jgi:hypothetical protein
MRAFAGLCVLISLILVGIAVVIGSKMLWNLGGLGPVGALGLVAVYLFIVAAVFASAADA